MTLITQITNGDQVAFGAVYEQYHTRLFHYFVKRTRVNETAKDLTQQAFIKLWQSRNTLSDAHTLDTQVFTIANSTLIDHLRKQAVERKHQQQLENELDEHTTFSYESFSDYESADYLDAVSETLPPGRKNVFMLKVVNGYSNRQVADQLSVSVKTVEEQYSKALKQVRSLITILLIHCSIFLQY